MSRVAHALLVLFTAACAAHDPNTGSVGSGPLRQAIALAGDGHESSQRDALAVFLALADSSPRNRQAITQGTARAFAAQMYINLGRPDSARPLARRAVELLGRKGGRAPPAVLTLLGETLQYLGSPDSALALYRRALSSLNPAGTRGEARLLNDIGSAHHDLGYPDSAGRYLAQALELRRRLGDSLGLAGTLSNLGRVQQTLGRPDSAATLFSAALPLRHRANDFAGLGATLNNLGYSLDLQGRPADALDRYREALEALGAAGNLSTQGLVRINMGRAFLALKQLDSAHAAVVEGLGIKRRVADSTGVSWGLVDLGRVQLARGDRRGATGSLQDARRVLRQIGDRGREGGVLYELGSLARRRGAGADPIGALARFDSAAALRSSVGTGSLLDSDRLSFAEQDLSLFEEWVSGWLGREDLPLEQTGLAALAVAERGRARALLDLMRQRSSALAPGSDLIREGRELVEWVQRSGSAALVYLVGRDTLTVWTIPASGGVTVRRLPVGRAEVAEAVRSYRVALGVERGCDAAAPGAADGLSGASATLASLLLDEATRARLAGSKSVIIVPHGPLHLVPFAALPGAGGAPLGSQFAIRYAPSLAILREASARPSVLAGDRLDRWRAMSPALIVGNPRMPLLTVCGVLLRPRGLEAAEESSRWLAGEVAAEALVGERATERRVRAEADGARLIHLETHGFAYENEAGARASFVALASDSGSPEPPPEGDGMLTVGEVLDQLPRLRAELVVLGACQTGLGDLKDAEGTVGLQRAFLARGARSTLVSLWTVDDLASSALLREFYRQWLAGGMSKSEALRRAQDSVRGMPEFEHPRFWAAFVLAGAD
jgi:CHAT domain-containing protein/tetratricopeptide (TPR) repeat protein